MNQLIKNTKKAGRLIIAVCLSFTASAQTSNCIQGVIVKSKNEAPVPYASVVLLNAGDSTQVKGTMSDMDGQFRFCNIREGSYLIHTSHVGYTPQRQFLKFKGKADYHAGTFRLKERSTGIKEVVILGERIKAKNEGDKTTFFINKKIQQATTTGVDVLKLMPGVQLDMMQNLSLEGGQNILILVDGRKRDLNFIRQLSPGSIDKIEINTSPGAEYASESSGVINVVLKEKTSGISGQINAELPTTSSEIYLFPNYSLQYGIKKFSFYTSYTGELSYFDIIDRQHRSYFENNGTNSIQKIQNLRQKNWSHRFNVGMDYHINEKNLINFYGYYNPFSQEHDGKTTLETNGSSIEDIYWSANREDTDKSNIAFLSLYYKHLFSENRRITFDLSYYNLHAENTTTYAVDSADGIENTLFSSKLNPETSTALVKIDFTTPINQNWQMNTGVKNTYKHYTGMDSEGFQQYENILAVYGNTAYNGSSFSLKAGVRYEQSVSQVKRMFSQTNASFLPSVKFNYKPAQNQNLSLSFRSGVYRPAFYELNPAVVYHDPFAFEKGNPLLKQENRHQVFLNYSLRSGSNFISSRLFFRKTTQKISKLTILNNDNMFETLLYNLGSCQQYGVQLTGAWSFGKAFSLRPYVKIYNLHTLPNESAIQHGIQKKQELEFETGLSAIATLKNDLTASMRFNYQSPRDYMQSSVYSDALYFLAVDKTIKKKFKVGLTCGIPFNRSFTYYGKDIEGEDFSSAWQGTIKTSGFPVWLKFSYRFNSGKKVNKIKRDKEHIQPIPQKGF